MNKYTAEIKISLHTGILDVQGKAIESSLHSIELSPISNVKVGKIILLDIIAESQEIALEVANTAASKLLANPIMEDFSVTIK